MLSCFFMQAQQVPSPSEFLGYPLGSEFTWHHQVISYYQHLAETDPNRVQLVQYGKTYEGRPLIAVFLSSEQNMAQLDDIRQAHLANLRGEQASEKAIVWMSYNVHGNESVSTEASMLTTYELLTEKQDMLENTVVVIDPCINPDGRDRYVNWYKQFRNTPFEADPNSKEHHEPWLSGRPNHYMFDLNRDWAWLTQVESQQRMKLFTQWMPHIHVDFHEQGMNNPYYFAPAAEPLHEVITDWQKDFQTQIGRNHARYFDQNGWLYFTKESFDLLYPSYGDTYPTYNGAIGMTYEQGGSGRAGLGVKIAIGDTLTLWDRISHHHTTGLSTVEISSQNAEKLNSEIRKFHTEKDNKYKSFVMEGDPDKIEALTGLLDAHGIEYGYTTQTPDGVNYMPGKTQNKNSKKLLVSTDQLKGTLVHVLFEPKTYLSDSLTYDITAWSLPYAYGLHAVASKKLLKADSNSAAAEPTTDFTADAYGYVSDWSSMKDARFLSELLQNNIRVRINRVPFGMQGKEFDRGSLIILRGDQKNTENLDQVLSDLAATHGKTLHPVNTGFADSGKDFGSTSVRMVKQPKIAIYSGGSTSTLSFGEVWHFFEQQLHYPASVLDAEYFGRADLEDYDILVLPNAYSLDKNHLEKIKAWTRGGGKLIAMGRTLDALERDEDFGLVATESKEDEENSKDTTTPQPYEMDDREDAKHMITGAIFESIVDPTHPLSYGYGNSYYSLKLGTNAYKWLDNGNAVYLPEEVRVMSGFVGSEALKKQGGSFVFASKRMGQGTAIYMVDNPLFRAFWENGKLFFANALFMTE